MTSFGTLLETNSPTPRGTIMRTERAKPARARHRVRWLAAATTLAVLVPWPAAASALPVPPPDGTVWINGTTLPYTAASLQANDLTLSRDGDQFMVDDSVALGAGAGCNQTLDPTVITCAALGITDVEINVGNLADEVTKTADVEATILGGPGADRIDAGPGGSHLFGGPGADVLIGGADQDWLDGGSGADTMNGGAQTDTVLYTNRTASVVASANGALNDDGEIGEGDSIGADVERIFGGSGNDNLTGNASVNRLNGNGGADTLDGGAGSDIVNGGAGDDALLGGAGNDSLVGGVGDDILNGGLGADTHTGGTGLDTASYLNRNDQITADLDGTAGDDGANGEADTINTDVENLRGGNALDHLTGNAGANRLEGQGGDDILNGNAGDDTLVGGLGGDTLNGGAGIDTVTYEGRLNQVQVSIDGDANDGANGEGDNVGMYVENIVGGSAGDFLVDNDADNHIWGGPGNDVLLGLGGFDVLDGGPGDNDDCDASPGGGTTQNCED